MMWIGFAFHATHFGNIYLIFFFTHTFHLLADTHEIFPLLEPFFPK